MYDIIICKHFQKKHKRKIYFRLCSPFNSIAHQGKRSFPLHVSFFSKIQQENVFYSSGLLPTTTKFCRKYFFEKLILEKVLTWNNSCHMKRIGLVFWYIIIHSQVKKCCVRNNYRKVKVGGGDLEESQVPLSLFWCEFFYV